jgi:hypothetical protein
MDSKRRRLLGLLGISPAILAGAKGTAAAALGGTAKQASGASASSGDLSGAGPRIEGLNPRGIPPPVDLYAMAPRLKTLDGKTVYLVSDGFPDADVFLNEVKIWFAKHMPSVKTIYRLKAGGFTDEDPKLNADIKANGNAVIMAIGH